MLIDNALKEKLAMLTASLRDESVHRHAMMAERRSAFAPRPMAQRCGTLKEEWDRYGGAAQDCLTFDRFLAELGVLIVCRSCGSQIDPCDVLPVVESGEDPRDYDWTCERCE